MGFESSYLYTIEHDFGRTRVLETFKICPVNSEFDPSLLDDVIVMCWGPKDLVQAVLSLTLYRTLYFTAMLH